MHVQISAFHLTTVDGSMTFSKRKIGVISDSTNEIMQAFDGSGFSAKRPCKNAASDVVLYSLRVTE